MRTLVLEPHADDLEIGCGGYVARQVRLGNEVLRVVVFMQPYRQADGSVLGVEARIHDLRASSAILGVRTAIWRMRDNALAAEDKPRAVQRLDRLIEKWRPQELLIPLPSPNQDHVDVWDIGRIGARYRTGVPRVPRLYAYGAPDLSDEFVPRSGRTYFAVGWGDHARRLHALAQHTTQNVRDQSNPHGVHAVDLWARQNGLMRGTTLADVLWLLEARE